MPVFSFVSSKGGAGKSTLVVTMASVLAYNGKRVYVLDTDPNAGVTYWSKIQPVDGITVEHTINEETMEDRIAAAKSEYDFVLVDAEGAASRSQTTVSALADMVILPMMPSRLDVMEAVKTSRVVKLIGRGRIPYVSIITKTPNFENSMWRDAITTCDAHVGHRLPVSLPDRVIYSTPFAFGGTIYDARDAASPSDRKRLDRQIAEAEDVVKGIINHFNNLEPVT